jgi:hypothetical protein
VPRFGGQRITFRYARGTQGAALPMQSNCCSHSVASQTTSTKQRLALHVSRIHSLRTQSLILKFSQLQPPCRLLRVRYCCASPAQPPAAPCSLLHDSTLSLAARREPVSNIESDIPDQGHRRRHEASKPRVLSPLTKLPGSGLPALSSAPHHYATPCVWPLSLACFGLAKEIPIEGTQHFMRKHLCVCLVTPLPLFSFF